MIEHSSANTDSVPVLFLAGSSTEVMDYDEAYSIDLSTAVVENFLNAVGIRDCLPPLQEKIPDSHLKKKNMRQAL